MKNNLASFTKSSGFPSEILNLSFLHIYSARKKFICVNSQCNVDVLCHPAACPTFLSCTSPPPPKTPAGRRLFSGASLDERRFICNRIKYRGESGLLSLPSSLSLGPSPLSLSAYGGFILRPAETSLHKAFLLRLLESFIDFSALLSLPAIAISLKSAIGS